MPLVRGTLGEATLKLDPTRFLFIPFQFIASIIPFRTS